MEDKVQRRGSGPRERRRHFGVADNQRRGFLAQMLIGQERHCGMARARNVAKLESAPRFVKTMRQPQRRANGIGRIVESTHRQTLPPRVGDGKHWP